MSLWAKAVKLRTLRLSLLEIAASQVARAFASRLPVLKEGHAMRVVFFYPGEEGTYVDNVDVRVYQNGIVEIRSKHEKTTTHLQNCEILWTFQVEADDRANKLRLLKPKNARSADANPEMGAADHESPQLET